MNTLRTFSSADPLQGYDKTQIELMKEQLILVNDQDEQIEDELSFYVSIYDSLHFYLHHLFQAGLRVMSSPTEDDDTKTAAEDIKDDRTDLIDEEFSRILNAVNKRRHMIDTFNRYGKKFDLTANETS